MVCEVNAGRTPWDDPGSAVAIDRRVGHIEFDDAQGSDLDAGTVPGRTVRIGAVCVGAVRA